MRACTLLIAALSAAALPASEVDNRTLLLIDPDAKIVRSVDIDRHTHSVLEQFFPVTPNAWQCGPACGRTPRRLIVVSGGEPKAQWEYTILEGGSPAISLPDLVDAEMHEGVPIVALGESIYGVVLDGNLSIHGDFERLRNAITRWRTADETSLGELARKVRQLSIQYDDWIVASRPLAAMIAERSRPAGRRAQEIADAVDELNAGIRFGRTNTIGLEVIAKTAEDAGSLAAIARWLPGILQIVSSGDVLPGRLLDLAEDLRITATGQTASLTFLLSESGLHELRQKILEEEKRDR